MIHLLMLFACGDKDPASADSQPAREGCPDGVGLTVGQCPPDFTLPDANGEDYTLNDNLGSQRILVVGSAHW